MLNLAQRIENDKAIVTAHLDRLDFLNGQHAEGLITCDEANSFAIVILNDLSWENWRREKCAY